MLRDAYLSQNSVGINVIWGLLRQSAEAVVSRNLQNAGHSELLSLFES